MSCVIKHFKLKQQTNKKKRKVLAAEYAVSNAYEDRKEETYYPVPRLKNVKKANKSPAGESTA